MFRNQILNYQKLSFREITPLIFDIGNITTTQNFVPNFKGFTANIVYRIFVKEIKTTLLFNQEEISIACCQPFTAITKLILASFWVAACAAKLHWYLGINLVVLTKLRFILRKEIETVPFFFAKLFNHYPSASSIKCPSGLKLSSMKIKSLS